VRARVIMSAAWKVLREDKSLLLLPVASSLCLLLLMALLFASTVGEAMAGAPLLEGLRQVQALSQLSVFLSSVLGYSIGIFFNAALAICVLRKLEGKPTTIGEGMKEALTCLPQIVGWALLSSTIGLLLRMIERRSGFIGRLVANVLGVAWSVAAFLVVPVLVAERKGPVSALQESVQLLRRTWGENILAGIGFGGLYFLLCIPGMLVFVIGAAMIPTHLIFAVVVMLSAILYFPLLGLVLSTLSTIFDVVLYRYAKWGTITPGFDCQLLIESFVTKPV
jgi:uncharacterized membrane protein